MAKPLGAKSQLIRQAISDNPGMGNKELAEMLMDSNERLDDKIQVTPQDVAQQRQQLKKGGAAPQPAPKAATPAEPAKPASKRRGRKPGTQVSPRPAAAASPVDLLEKTLDLAQQCGGVQQLKRLVDRIAEMGG